MPALALVIFVQVLQGVVVETCKGLGSKIEQSKTMVGMGSMEKEDIGREDDGIEELIGEE